MRPLVSALRSVCVTACCPTTSSKRWGRHLRARTVYMKGRTLSTADESRRASHRDPGGPAAHVSDYLALLPSGPDAVHRLKLHRFRAAVRRAAGIGRFSLVARPQDGKRGSDVPARGHPGLLEYVDSR